MGLNVVTGELYQAGYPDAYFDVITLFEILEHVESPIRLLEETRRILKDDGLVGIVVPNLESYNARHNPEWWEPYHFYHFSQQTLERLLSKTDFVPLRVAVNPHLSGLIPPAKKAMVYKYLGWAARWVRRLSPYLLKVGPYKGLTAGLTIYAVKQT